MSEPNEPFVVDKIISKIVKDLIPGDVPRENFKRQMLWEILQGNLHGKEHRRINIGKVAMERAYNPQRDLTEQFEQITATINSWKLLSPLTVADIRNVLEPAITAATGEQPEIEQSVASSMAEKHARRTSRPALQARLGGTI